MGETIHEYDAKLDARKRLTLRETSYQYYHVQEMDNGTIVLFPRVLVSPPSQDTGVNTAVDNKSGLTEPIYINSIKSNRFGAAKGIFTVPDEFYDWDQEIEKMFEERI